MRKIDLNKVMTELGRLVCFNVCGSTRYYSVMDYYEVRIYQDAEVYDSKGRPSYVEWSVELTWIHGSNKLAGKIFDYLKSVINELLPDVDCYLLRKDDFSVVEID